MKLSPTDVLCDVLLAQCSPGATGVWWRMMCNMHLTDEYGVLARNGVAMTKAEIARLVGWSRRTVEPFLAELERNGVYSVDSRGAIYCRRMVRDYATHLRSVEDGKKGGNPKLKPKGSVGSTIIRVPVEVHSPSTGAPVERDTTGKKQPIVNNTNEIEEKTVNPPHKADSDSESEDRKKEGSPADSPRAKGAAHGSSSPVDNVVGLRKGQVPSVAPEQPKQAPLPMPPTAVKTVRKEPAGPVMRSGFERERPRGDPVALANAQTALDAWNALALVLGMAQASMSADRRGRITRILQTFGGLDGWRAALVKVEESDFWSGRSGHPYKPTIDLFIKPEKFRCLMEGGYSSRQPQSGAGRGKGGAGAGPDRPGPLDAVYDKWAALAAAGGGG